MRSVGLKVLKNRLSEYVRLAEAGETVLVTDRDRVVAELVPPRSRRSDMLDDPVLGELVRRGVLSPARAPFTGPPPRGEGVMKLEELLRGLSEDRADRWEPDG